MSRCLCSLPGERRRKDCGLWSVNVAVVAVVSMDLWSNSNPGVQNLGKYDERGESGKLGGQF